MKEVLRLRRQDEELCRRLGLDPYYVSSTTVPTTDQMEGLLDHIRTLEEEKFVQEEKLLTMKADLIRLYEELETEPVNEFERDVACEDIERITLSGTNLTAIAAVVAKLEDQLKVNQREVMMSVERLDNLYGRLQLDMKDKFDFLAENPGYSPSALRKLHLEIERLEEIKKANIEKFVTTLRDELHRVWDECFYSLEQRNLFSPLHSIDFNEQLLEQHENEVERMKNYLEVHQILFKKVAERQELWNKAMDLERRAKDPTRLMNARGNSLLMEEKERNKVNKALPRVEEDLKRLISEWESEQCTEFLVGGVCLADFIAQQQEDHLKQLDVEKQARERVKKETLLQETRFGARPVTPAKLKQNSTLKTPRRNHGITPTATKIVSRVRNAVNKSLRSPTAGRVAKGVSPRLIPPSKKGKKGARDNREKIKRGILADVNNKIIADDTIRTRPSMANLSVASTDYNKFKQGNLLNSTEAGVTPEPTSSRTPSYMTPTQNTISRGGFKTPTTPTSRTRVVTGSSSKLSTFRGSSKNLPFLI